MPPCRANSPGCAPWRRSSSAGATAYTTTARATNRLLVGPFASNRAAQEFVNQLAGRNVTAFAWTSAAGQEIERLQTR